MLSSNFKRNKKAQTSETMTWIVVTVVLIIILFIFIYATIALSKTKEIKSQKTDDIESDWIKTKSEIAFDLVDNNEEKIRIWIAKEDRYEGQ